MSVKTARRYLDLGPEVFRREITRQLPAVVLGGRRHFARADLDRWVDKRLGRATTGNDTNWEHLIDADLQDTRHK